MTPLDFQEIKLDKYKKNKNFSGPSKNNIIQNIPWRLHLLVCSLGFLVIITMSYGFYLGNHVAVKYAPLVDAAMEIKLEATTAHLWVEELISGDRFEDINEVKKHLDQAQWYASAMLEGGENPEGKFIPLKNPVLRGEVEKIFQKINTFRKITDQRFEAIQESGTGTQIDQRYDAIFRDFIGQADRVESKLQAEIATEIKIFKIVQTTLILISFLLIGVIVWVFHRFERRRSSDIQLINATNEELQKALQEIKTLRGIFPICGYCKKIRDEQGHWNQLEAYIHNHSEAEFSHGICPDCYRKQIEELEKNG